MIATRCLLPGTVCICTVYHTVRVLRVLHSKHGSQLRIPEIGIFQRYFTTTIKNTGKKC